MHAGVQKIVTVMIAVFHLSQSKNTIAFGTDAEDIVVTGKPVVASTIVE